MKSKSRSYDGNACPLVEGHGPMIPYPAGLFYCPNSAHARARIPETALFKLSTEGWQVAIALGGWAMVVPQGSVPADSTSAAPTPD